MLHSLPNLKDDAYIDVTSTLIADSNPFSLGQAHQVPNTVAISDNLNELPDFIIPDDEASLQIQEDDKYDLKISNTEFAEWEKAHFGITTVMSPDPPAPSSTNEPSKTEAPAAAPMHGTAAEESESAKVSFFFQDKSGAGNP